MKRWIVGTIAAGAVAIGACGGSTSGVGSVSAQQACTDVAAAVCTAVNTCSPILMQLEYGDVSTCEKRFTTTCTSSLSANGTGMTPADMEACAKAVAGEGCADIVSNNPPSACHAVVGQLANGTACSDPSQCQSQYCNRGTDGTCGACAARGSGAACHRDEDCEYGQLCLTPTGAAATSVTPGACIEPGASGATCDPAHPCNKTLACKNGTCTTPDEAGATCVVGDTANPFGSCDVLKGALCQPLTRVCVAIGVASAGQPCGAINGGYTACSANGACNSGTCEAAGMDGASCNGTTMKCLPPAACSGGVCKLSDPSMCH
jgi:hypothetical protein